MSHKSSSSSKPSVSFIVCQGSPRRKVIVFEATDLPLDSVHLPLQNHPLHACLKSSKPNSTQEEKEASRSVSFFPSVEEYYTLARVDYSLEEQENSWYDAEEYDDIIYECMQILKRMANGQHVSKRKHCTRGLERMTPDAQDLKVTLREEAYMAVLEEQARQRMRGACNPEAIAALYIQAQSQFYQDLAYSNQLVPTSKPSYRHRFSNTSFAGNIDDAEIRSHVFKI
eukprot:scaffold6784_cov108-Cylindrotheca_fusiformis.AAC.4